MDFTGNDLFPAKLLLESQYWMTNSLTSVFSNTYIRVLAFRKILDLQHNVISLESNYNALSKMSTIDGLSSDSTN